MAIIDPTQCVGAIKALAAEGIVYAWEPTMDRASGLFRINSSGGIVLLGSGERIPGDPAAIRTSLAGTRRATSRAKLAPTPSAA